ncbi:MAG: GtrA family protein [Parvibaculaceae bacterium]|nr:GtrA family protein [Parvibaculaceae bacterium]
MRFQTLVARYIFFAILATAANLIVQRIVLLVEAGTIGFILAMFAGTLAGLLLKYVLDKKWIFYDHGTGLKTHQKKFALYSLMGLATTGIFWGTETTFWFVWKTDLMRELGAILGLTIGYVVKYNLDRRFVFTDAQIKQGGEQ